jgi:hypothetical protein
MKRISPALVLFFLAPAIGELLSGSAPPVEFFNPFMLIVLTALYGSGAILVRELALRWDKRWPTILVLGLAYGILEEGLMVKSFFDPSWPDLGIMGVYGRWAGVNWVWSLFLTIYHAIFSIAIPILLVELLFPDKRDEHWIGQRGMIGFSLLLIVDVLLGCFVLTTYRPPTFPYAMALIVVMSLYLLARRMPLQWPIPHGSKIRRPIQFGFVGFSGTFALFLIHWIFPEINVPPPVTMLVALILVAVVLWAVWSMSGGGAWTDEHRLALVSGALTFFMLLAPLAELDTTRPDNPSGMTLVGLTTLVILLWLRARTRRRLQSEANLQLST